MMRLMTIYIDFDLNKYAFPVTQRDRNQPSATIKTFIYDLRKASGR